MGELAHTATLLVVVGRGRLVADTSVAARAGITRLAGGIVAVFGSWLAGRLILGGNGYTAAHGDPTTSLADPSTLRHCGLGPPPRADRLAQFRYRYRRAGLATALAFVLAAPFLFPILMQVVSSPHWPRHRQQISRMNAGLTIQATITLRGLPPNRGAGLGVLLCGAAAAMVAAGYCSSGGTPDVKW